MKKLILIIAVALFAVAANARNKPKAEYKVGECKVVVWENESKIGGKWRNFKIEKVYKKDSEWKSINYFDEKELIQLKEAIDKTIKEEIVEVKEENKD